MIIGRSSHSTNILFQELDFQQLKVYLKMKIYNFLTQCKSPLQKYNQIKETKIRNKKECLLQNKLLFYQMTYIAKGIWATISMTVLLFNVSLPFCNFN